MKPTALFRTLAFRFGALIILIEVVVLAGVGYLYVTRFSAELERRIQDRVQLPGALINAGLLRYESVADRPTMASLVGEDLLEGMIVGVNRTVFYSLEPTHLGRDIGAIPGLDPTLFYPGNTETRVIRDGDSMVCISPIFAAEGRTPRFFAYVRAATTAAGVEKNRIVWLFVAGSAITVLLTSAIIVLSFRWSILRRLQDVLRVLRAVESGDLSARISLPVGSDEIGTLQEGVDSMTERLSETIGDLEVKNAELERFTYTVSHDLKSPLVTILGFTGMLERDVQSGDRERIDEDLSRIGGAAREMRRLLEDLLELSRIGRVVHESEKVSLTDLAQEAVELVAGQIAARGADVAIDSGMPTVRVDRLRLREVLQNLVENAVKFMGDQASPRIEIDAARVGDEVICRVRDNGVGIEPKYQTRIFELFERLDPKVDGTGIGLTLAQRIVEVHGGRIWVESHGSGEGSTFAFALPLAEPDKAEPGEDETPS